MKRKKKKHKNWIARSFSPRGLLSHEQFTGELFCIFSEDPTPALFNHLFKVLLDPSPILNPSRKCQTRCGEGMGESSVWLSQTC